ncbi:MAG: M48 family metallopeptidase, partial [Rikenellaceae bacterium]
LYIIVKDRRTKNPPATTFDVEELRRKAIEYIPKRVEEISAATGLKYNRLIIRPTQTKWGSCSSQKNISLSLYLMSLPKHLIDFVIVHELCHTVHFNHSAEFHALVNRVVGGKEKLLNKELKGYSIR